MSNWTEEYLWDRQEAEQRASEAMKHTTLGKFVSALHIYFLQKNMNEVKGVERMKDYNRISCPVCNYPMRVLSHENGVYQCYCAECKMDRYVKKELEE